MPSASRWTKSKSGFCAGFWICRVWFSFSRVQSAGNGISSRLRLVGILTLAVGSVVWKSLCDFLLGSLICFMRSGNSSSCLGRTSIVLFLQQLSVDNKVSFGLLEVLSGTLGDDESWWIWQTLWLVGLLGDSWLSSKVFGTFVSSEGMLLLYGW